MEKEITFYVDGACSKNPGPGGYASIIYNNNTKILESVKCEYFQNTTNNRMELMAMIYAIEYANYCNEEGIKFIIYTDSAYVCNMINQGWIYNWAINSWMNSKKQVVENVDLVQRLYKNLIINFPKNQVVIKKIKGHSGIIGNEIADAVASKNKNKFNKILKENNISKSIIVDF